MATLVFVFNGNAFAPAKPSSLTHQAAAVLNRAGHRAVELANPALGSLKGFERVVRTIKGLSHGRPIGIVGFSAGGSLALRLAEIPSLHVAAVLDYYGPPDLADTLAYHRGDAIDRYVATHVHLTTAAIDLFSGPGPTTAHIVAAFGLKDQNTVALPNTVSLLRDFPEAQTFFYNGPHGASITASHAALSAFLADL